MNFCSICIKVFSDKLSNQSLIHCSKCDNCHLNNKNIYCELCNTCINLNNDLEVFRHSKRHAQTLEFKSKRKN